MAVNPRVVGRLLATINTLVASPHVDQYLVGVTRDSRWKAGSYFRIEFEHYVSVAFCLRPRDALELERTLFTQLTSDKRSVSYRKYHHEKRDKRYYPSLGGKVLASAPDRYDVYVTWWNR